MNEQQEHGAKQLLMNAFLSCFSGPQVLYSQWFIMWKRWEKSLDGFFGERWKLLQEGKKNQKHSVRSCRWLGVWQKEHPIPESSFSQIRIDREESCSFLGDPHAVVWTDVYVGSAERERPGLSSQLQDNLLGLEMVDPCDEWARRGVLFLSGYGYPASPVYSWGGGKSLCTKGFFQENFHKGGWPRALDFPR